METHDYTLQTPEDQLQQARKQYVNTLTNETQFEADCLIIIPNLERLWKEKILVFGFPADTLIAWENYLRVFKPQLLEEGIDLLAKRLKSHEERYGSVLPQPHLTPTNEEIWAENDNTKMVERINRAGGVQDVRAYYRSLVQELRRNEMKANPVRKVFNESIMKYVLEQAEGMDIAFNIPQQWYDTAGVRVPEEHRQFAIKMGWIEEGKLVPKEKLIEPTRRFPDKLTVKGEAILEGLRGGFGIAFLIAVN